MSGNGSSVTDKVKVTDKSRKRKTADLERKTQIDNNESTFETITDDIKIEEETDPLADSETAQQNGNEEDHNNTPVIVDDQVKGAPPPPPPAAPPIEDLDETTQDAEVFGFDKDSDVDEGHIEESCFKIDKVYSVAKDDEKKQKIKNAESSNVSAKKTVPKSDGKQVKNEESKKNTKDEKLLKPKTALTTLAKVPGLTSGVRLLSGGVRGTNMPLLVSMGAGNAGIPLLPAGLPPGRYVILPGTSTTTKTTCTTVNTTSASMAPRLATGVTLPVPSATGNAAAAAAVGQATSSAATVAAVAAARSLTPTLQVPHRAHTRERGRRKSYTTGEKLAMIEAVEAGQRKSTVADRFGVAPSTLACILAQKNKIRAEQDNLTRRRFRHGKYLGDEGGRVSVSCRVPTSNTPTLHTLATTSDQAFTHFLASLTGPAPSVFDTQPEEIIAVPDLMEGGRGGGGGGGPGISGENEGKGEDDADDDDGGSGIECLGAIETVDVEYRDLSHDKSNVFPHHHTPRLQQHDGIEESSTHELSDRPSSPTNTSQVTGLTGPYLLKKETHCSTVLDQLLRDDTYTDVTLTAEGQSLRAHRIVLSLSSPYFRQALSREQNVQSVVLLRDVKFAELRNIIHFIYTGEATVDASDLESFMRTAEMLEISSLSEGQKYISSRGLTQGGAASGFSIGDFERLVGTKRSNKESSSPPSKSRRISGECPSSRCSSSEPTVTSNPLALIKEEPNCDPPSTSQIEKGEIEKPIVDPLGTAESTSGETTSLEGEVSGSKRKRRDSSGSIGGFAAIAGIQKVSSEAEDEDEVFCSTSKSSPNLQADNSKQPTNSDADNSACPGRCPYCPHVNQKFEGVAMMRHLLVSHPCKPAFPCSFCWRVFVKRTNFKNHSQKCQQSY